MRKQGSTHSLYSRIAKIYDLVYGPFLDKGRESLFHALNLKGDQEILEVGIGTGLSLSSYPKDAHVIGVDINDEMLKEAQKKAQRLNMKNVRLVNMSAEALNFPDDTFDVVTCPSVLSVVPNPEKALNEMIRVCKREGVICVVSHFTGETSLTKFIDKGFNPISSHFLGFHMNTPRDLVEKNSKVTVLLKKQIWFLNFSHLYLLKKV